MSYEEATEENTSATIGIAQMSTFVFTFFCFFLILSK